VTRVLGVLNGEILKLRKRPAVWICIAILVVILLAFGYLIEYFIYTYTTAATGGPNAPPPGTPSYKVLKQALYPLHFVQNTIQGGTQLGGVLAMIIGVLAQGSEYGWGSIKTAFTQRPRRLEWLAGKMVSVALTMLVMSLVLLLVAAATSLLLATIDGADRTWPNTTTIVKGILATWLIYCFWAFFGFGLATLFRQSAMAIGLGLAYALVIEALIFGLLSGFVGDPVRRVQQWFPLANAGYLVSSFGQAVRFRGGETAPYADATHAVVMLALYTAAFIVLAAVLIQRRDVTS
jgi:ABC-type transport system involved in multi-copper enzyme maturation permease subunit